MAEFVVENVTKRFATPAGDLRILDGVSVSLSRGQNLAVLGPSGCGKSTFLHIAGTLDRPTSGDIALEGVNPFALPDRELASFRNQRIGFIFQEHHLLPQLTALENVLLPVLAERRVDSGAIARARELLEQVGLADRADHRPAELSGGERQRVAVARALVQKPLLLLADEPTGSLDENNAAGIGEILLDVQRRFDTILICVTHSQALADRFQTRVKLVAGRFVS